MYDVFLFDKSLYKVKSRKYQGVFEVKSRVKTFVKFEELISTIGALASANMGDRDQVSVRVIAFPAG